MIDTQNVSSITDSQKSVKQTLTMKLGCAVAIGVLLSIYPHIC